MTHLDWSKDGEKLQSTSTDYELLFCKSIILKLILALYYLHIALRLSLSWLDFMNNEMYFIFSNEGRERERPY